VNVAAYSTANAQRNREDKVKTRAEKNAKKQRKGSNQSNIMRSYYRRLKILQGETDCFADNDSIYCNEKV